MHIAITMVTITSVSAMAFVRRGRVVSNGSMGSVEVELIDYV